jgi:DNA-binding transcriptional LysR family regulator
MKRIHLAQVRDNKMNLHQLEAFHAIVVSGSFSEAANQVHLTRSALSHQIKNLEQELGKALLVRAKPKVYPTPAGHVLLTSIARIFGELRTVKEKFGLLPGVERSSVRVAATNLGLSYIYGDLCERFIADHPDVDFTITATETTEDAVVRVARRSVDFAFTTLPVDLPNLQSVHLGDSEQVFIVGKSHPLAKQRKVSFNDIQACTFVRFVPGTGGRDFSDHIFTKSGGYPAIMTESNDTEVIKRIVGMGLAVALVPAFSVASELRTNRLRALRLSSGRMMQSFGLVHYKDLRTEAMDLFRALCLKLRGANPIKIRLENFGRAPWTIDREEPHVISRVTKRSKRSNR